MIMIMVTMIMVVTVKIVHPAWVRLIQTGRNYAWSHNCHLDIFICYIYDHYKDDEDQSNETDEITGSSVASVAKRLSARA